VGELVGFPAERAGRPSLARLKCEECGGLPMIFVPVGVLVHAYCSPDCAAGCGVAPWAAADLVDRIGWRSRAELEAAPK
jgi:hypothetical protein